MRLFLYLLIANITANFNLLGQSDLECDTLETSGFKKSSYINISTGISRTIYRDFATSPLLYRGYPLNFSLAHLDQSDQRYSRIKATYSLGKFSPIQLGNSVRSNLQSWQIDYEELFQIKAVDDNNWNLKVGGKLTSTLNFRENEAFGNNSTGFEVVSNLFASSKVTRFITSKKNNLRSGFSYLLNVGLVNTAFRNKFIYTSHAPLLNQDNIYGGYELYLFSGYRFNSELNYTLWIKNNNAVQIGYNWDLYSTRERFTSFQMATHTIEFTLLYHLK
jgi:hypothetical protein